jgi:hypothetical protein
MTLPPTNQERPPLQYLEPVRRLLTELRTQATASGDSYTAQSAERVVSAVEDLVRLTLTYRDAIQGVLDLPWPGAEVHNRYLHFVLDHGRMPNELENRTLISTDHERHFGHPFIQAEGAVSQGQCRDCLEDPAGTKYGSEGAH